jgi:hypothetical protein
MTPIKRKVSPRAPSLALDEAISRVAKMYVAEGGHATPLEVALKHIGYSSKNGAAVQAMASLGYWGLVERLKDGVVKVAKAVEDYQYTPDEAHKQDLLIRFLRNPPLFASLLEKYKERLPSDGTLQYDLIQAGFTPSAAATCLSVFKRSVEFARYFDRSRNSSVVGEGAREDVEKVGSDEAAGHAADVVEEGKVVAAKNGPVQPQRDSGSAVQEDSGIDRIPIRLAGGRRAWLEIPSPFFSADRERLKKHIDLLLTDDEDDGSDAVDSDQ